MALTKLPGFTLDSTSNTTFANTTVTGNLTSGNANLGNLAIANYFSGSGNLLSNIQVANVTGLGNLATVNKDGNSSNILYGNGVFASAPVTYGNSNVVTLLSSYGSNTIVTTGNITGGNIIGIIAAGSNTITTTGNADVGNLGFGSGVITGTGNITAGNANLGNATTSNYFIGNGSLLTGLSASYSNSNVANYLPTYTGNFTAGNITTGTLYTTGTVVPRVVSITNGTSVTMNGDTTDMATQTNTQVAGTLTINAVSGTIVDGQKIVFRLQSTNVQTFSWNAVFVGSSDLPLPTASSGSSKYDYMGFVYNSTASKWQILAKNFGF